MIPALIRKMVEGHERGDEQIVLWGDGTPSARVPVRGRLRRGHCCWRPSATTSPSRSTWEPAFEITIRELAELIAGADRVRGPARVGHAASPNGQPRRCLDTSRAEREFGFVARTEFREGLERTIEFFRSERSWVMSDEQRRREAEQRANARTAVGAA